MPIQGMLVLQVLLYPISKAFIMDQLHTKKLIVNSMDINFMHMTIYHMMKEQLMLKCV